jgi:parallel beta-helix repeat protein
MSGIKRKQKRKIILNNLVINTLLLSLIFPGIILILSHSHFAYAGLPKHIFYVATDGNDKWSGALPSPAESGKDGPFATLEQAHNTIRRLRKGNHEGEFIVLVRGGTYYLEKTFTLGVEDSGTETCPTTFKAYQREIPILSGAQQVTNFERYKEKIQQADLNGIIDDTFQPGQLFVKKKRQILARYPNRNKANPIAGGFLYVDNTSKSENTTIIKYTDDITANWKSLLHAQVVIFPGHNWTNNILTGLQIDEKTRTITSSQNTSHPIKNGNRYYFQNLLEELDSPGEWYFDPLKKILYFWPENDLDLETVTIPTIKTILEIKNGKSVHNFPATPMNIKFEGFILEGATGSAIVVNGANKIIINGNTIRNTGLNGIEIIDGTKNIVFGNDVYDVGHTGIIVSGGNFKTLSPAKNKVENNYIHDTGAIFKGGASGILCKGVGNTVANNYIHSTPRVGIWFEGNDHLIEYNYIHHTNMETQDSGIIYAGQIDWAKRGTVIQYNFLHSSGGYGRNDVKGPWQSPCETYGIYLDDWASGTKVYGNIIKNTANGGIFIHGGRDNVIENNIVINGGRLGQIVFSAWLPDHHVAQKWLPIMFQKVLESGYKKYPGLSTITSLETGATMSGNRVLKNVLYFKPPDDVLFDINNAMDFNSTVSDYNVIYSGDRPLRVSLPLKAADEKQWVEWRSKGLDLHSLVADPHFSDITNNNFNLDQNSPALKIGFEPIPFEKIGLYKDPGRASWSEEYILTSN